MQQQISEKSIFFLQNNVVASQIAKMSELITPRFFGSIIAHLLYIIF